MNAAVSTARTRKRKRTLLPLLVVLFLISYGLLTKLVIEQDKTIDSQRTLIHLLFKDSVQLSALRKAERKESRAHAGQGTSLNSLPSQARPDAKIPIIQVPSGKNPSNQVQSNQVQSERVPFGKTREQSGSKAERKAGKAQKPAPNRPPAELTDPSDMRRVSVAI
jgi:hypothetical protein